MYRYQMLVGWLVLMGAVTCQGGTDPADFATTADGMVVVDPTSRSEMDRGKFPYRWAFHWGRMADLSGQTGAVKVRIDDLLVRSEDTPESPVSVTGNSPMFNWAAPVVTGTDGMVDPALRSIDVGFQGVPVVYAIRVEPGETYRLIAGICEGHHQEAGQRINRFVIDGREVGTLDTMRDGRNVPIYETFSATDDDHDGVIRFEVGTTEKSPDRNSILNVLWLLPGDSAEPTRESLIAGNVPEAILHHDASVSAQKPLHLKMTIERYGVTAADGTAGPIFVIDSEGTPGVVRNASGDYTISGEIRVRSSGGIFRLRSIVNQSVELEWVSTSGESPTVEILRGLP